MSELEKFAKQGGGVSRTMSELGYPGHYPRYPPPQFFLHFLHVFYIFLPYFSTNHVLLAHAGRVPLRVSAPTVIPVCDYWNRSKTDVLSPQDGRTRIQAQTNISSATAADKHTMGQIEGRAKVIVNEAIVTGLKSRIFG